VVLASFGLSCGGSSLIVSTCPGFASFGPRIPRGLPAARAQQPAMPRIGWLGGGLVDAYIRAIVFLARRGVTVRFTIAGVTSRRCGFAM
jgi:hypothetical protein